MAVQSGTVNREREVRVLSGWVVLVLHLALIAELVYTFIRVISAHDRRGDVAASTVVMLVLMAVAAFIALFGYFTLQPNEARMLILFGAYRGTVRRSGFHWANPFYSREPSRLVAAQQAHGIRNVVRLSLRARNFNSERLKVNDKRGNPIEIAAVVVWKVCDTAQAAFDVDDYENYVRVQSESAIRHLASTYAYDHGEENELTLRSSVAEVSASLRTELQERLAKAGVEVDEARLTHLAYAPEIAQAMLRRQQAEAIIAARQKIVHGAVSMVDMALKELSDRKVVTLDDERRATMVSNLMVVLCAESEVHPVINAGTLYT